MRQLISKIIRHICSYSVDIGIVKKTKRQEGISAIIRAKNEHEWVKASIESISPYVDEIIFVDNMSNDGTFEIANKLKDVLTNLKIYRTDMLEPWNYSNFALSKTSYRWILKWDADFVAIENKDYGIKQLLENIKILNKDRYYYIKLCFYELAGDFKHQFKDIRKRYDIEIFTWSEDIKWVPVERVFPSKKHYIKFSKDEYIPSIFHINFEGLKIPIYYQIKTFRFPVGFHLNIKSAERTLAGYFFTQWLLEENLKKFPSFESFLTYCIEKYWKINNLETAAKFFLQEYIRNLVPSELEIKDLPPNIRQLANQSPYNIIYKDGKIISRNDIL